MSIFSSIMNKIFHRDAVAAPSSSAASAAAPQGAPQHAQAAAAPGGAARTSTATSSPAAPASSGSAQAVDVEAVLGGMAAMNGQKLDWQHSIVDLMKLLDLDSSLAARKELARELNYTGDTGDSAKMNIWLHKQVMQKLADNGGKVPESLRA
jgi:hypothetical protein